MPTAGTVRSVLVVVGNRWVHERSPYFVHGLVDAWRAAGLSVEVSDRLPAHADADLVMNHVDLTVTPADHAAFLARCPRALNGRLLDISKRRTADGLLEGPGGAHGPVIVKTDRNAGGTPEAEWRSPDAWARRAARVGRWARAVGVLPGEAPFPVEPYSVWDAADRVPAAVWSDARLVVQPFVPERDEALYAVRLYLFLGRRHVTLRVRGREPIVKSTELVDYQILPGPPDELLRLRAQLGMDYGKIDYVEHQGRVFVFDVNRTPMRARRAKDGPPADADLEARYAALADGLHDL